MLSNLYSGESFWDHANKPQASQRFNQSLRSLLLPSLLLHFWNRIQVAGTADFLIIHTTNCQSERGQRPTRPATRDRQTDRQTETRTKRRDATCINKDVAGPTERLYHTQCSLWSWLDALIMSRRCIAPHARSFEPLGTVRSTTDLGLTATFFRAGVH